MRSLVFLPPPSLSQFDSAPQTHSRGWASFTVAQPQPRVVADETRPTHQDEGDIDLVPDSVDPNYHELIDDEQDDSLALSDVAPPARILADETRPTHSKDAAVETVPDSVDPRCSHDDPLENGDEYVMPSDAPFLPAQTLADERRPIGNDTTEIVPDSVDPHGHPLDEESLARSELSDAPVSVLSEDLQKAGVATVDDGDREEASRALKRVRIRESPVVVIETPERRVHPTEARGVVFQTASGNRSRNQTAEKAAGISMDEESEAAEDKSRVVVGEDSESEEELPEEAGESSRSIASQSVIPPTQANDHTSGSIPLGTVEAETSTIAIVHKPELHRDWSDLAFLAGIPSRLATHTTASAQTAAIPANTSAADITESTSAATQSASSLQIRPPVPAAGAPQATCRFTFFRRSRGSTSIGSISTASHLAQPPESEPHPASASISVGPMPTAVAARPAAPIPHAPTRLAEPSLHKLPTMNATSASHDSLAFREDSLSSLAQQSILPPPTLHFALSTITPVSRILANPSHYLPPTSGGSRARFGEVGGVSSRVNLLVVVKEVGEASRVRSKFAVEPPPPAAKSFTGRGELRGGSRAFTEAASHTSVVGDGRTERVQLLVMDGSMSTVPRLVDSESAEWKLVDEIAERCLFQVVLWGSLARDWTTPNPSTSSPDAHTTFTPTQLRPGDVVSLTNLSLSRLAPSSPIKKPPRRLGPGLPPPEPSRLTLVAHASAANGANVELCYRSQVLTTEDAGRNFDADLAAFDLRSRRVLELGRLWTASER
ncbi:hypothetical protein PSEUBRA_003657 [Kalmanozyma brasiliensis GHG001]|uniref:uncharacterized protein n=1 Tax=Kalmanozyma brasiliensis (strain GHG001) TaxID=1365824 RepID=UPI002867C377|nr:uncharacterized protein PSEUBRA_003657 [Kalmanozyma brasiliensis GHG001]KAF6767272.1 hypothetical protein PSEUBRA_003657 [Kalmanozyma brasiliensis GHG001]